MALVFYNSPESAVECALEISRALKEHPQLQSRMGVHSGPISGVIDVNERANIAGAGINLAQRVMDCGDAGHILLSKRVAEDLDQILTLATAPTRPRRMRRQTRRAPPRCQSLHRGSRHPQLPKKFQSLKKRNARVRWAGMTAALFALAAIIAGIAIFSHHRVRSTPVASEKSIAVLPVRQPKSRP